MQRISPPAALVGGLVLALLGFLGGRAFGPTNSSSSGLEAKAVAQDAGGADAGGNASTDGASANADDSTVLTAALPTPGPQGASPFARLLDGTVVPGLPAGTPKRVRVGVVLVSFAGAEPAVAMRGPEHKVTRTRAEALALAESLAEAAKSDFHGAVQKGDPGSSDDIGSIGVGELEPAANYVLFTLPKGGIGGPVETPRGFWIMRRVD